MESDTDPENLDQAAMKMDPDPDLSNKKQSSYDPCMNHQQAMAYFEAEINDIVKDDPLLSYLPPGVTLDELNSLLALEHGRAMTVIIHRADNQQYSVIVEQKATVMDLKKAIQRHVTLKMKREGSERSLSWRYVWKSYWLYFSGQKLTEDNKPLKEYGIRNNSELGFVKRLKIK